MHFGRGSILFTAFLGALFCTLNATGAEILCLTKGCQIYAGYSLFGLPFYFYGIIAFLLIFLLTSFYPRGKTDFLLYYLISIVLAADILFLGYQYLYWTCSSCLAVAFLFGLVALICLSVFSWKDRWLLKGLLLGWLLLLTYNGFSAVKEAAFSPWPLYGDRGAPYKVFFSPTCPACKEAVLQILDNPEVARFTAFFPLLKSEKDERRLAFFLHGGVERNDVQNLSLLFDDHSERAFSLSLEEKLHLWSNKITLASKGVSTVPLIMGSRLPVLPAARQEGFLPEDSSSSGDANWFLPPEGCSAAETPENCD